MMPIIKYPRTPHLKGSRLQPGDDTSGQISIREMKRGTLVFEEKLDGANVGLSVAPSGEIIIQSRGHALRGGAREAQFSILKAWAMTHEAVIRSILGERYVLYGEWLQYCHSIFYDDLPSLLFEFDLFDKKSEKFISTPVRHRILEGSPIVSVPVVHTGTPRSDEAVEALIGPSLYKTQAWRESLDKAAERAGRDPEQVRRETFMSDLAEGVYLKWEEGDYVIGRGKFVHRSFVQTIVDSGSHWSARVPIENVLNPAVDIFAGHAAERRTP